MKKIIPINVTAEGLAPTLTAVYYKKGAYNFLKENCMIPGNHLKHSEMAVIEIYEDGEDDKEDRESVRSDGRVLRGEHL